MVDTSRNCKMLCEISNINYGTRVVKSKVEGDEYPVYGGGGETFRINKFNRENCVIVSRFAMSPKCTRYVKKKIFLNDSGLTVSTKDNSLLLQEYLNWYLLSMNDEIYSLGRGAGQRNLEIPSFKRMLISYPVDLDEQQKIVSILDKADEIRTKKKQANEKLDEFLKSTFVDMFGDPVNNTKNYPVQNIASFAKVKIGPFGNSLHKEEYITDGIPLVNPSQIVDEKIVFDSSVSITEKKYKELQAYWLQKDDIIIGRRGEIGRAAVVSNNVRCICGTGSLFIRINKPVIQPLILQKIISSNTMKEKLLNNSVGVTMNNLNAGIIENLGIAIPPIEHQNKFAQIVKKVEEQKQRNEKVIEQMDNLFNSLSQRAFKGEL